jgi:hypothetical protein
MGHILYETLPVGLDSFILTHNIYKTEAGPGPPDPLHAHRRGPPLGRAGACVFAFVWSVGWRTSQYTHHHPNKQGPFDAILHKLSEDVVRRAWDAGEFVACAYPLRVCASRH